VELRHAYADPKHRQSRHVNVLVLPTLARLATALAEREFPLDRAAFCHADPGAPEIYAQLYHCAIGFGAEDNTLRFPAENLSIGLRNADEYFERHLIEIAEGALQSIVSNDSFAARVRSAIVETMEHGNIGVQPVSRRLAMSSRTLQRRLMEEGATFQVLLDEVRAGLAGQYLRRSGLTVDEVGFMLGYAERGAFHRAFRRWTGQTPTEYVRGQR
jgi:AraC-like DNA-binding protein